MARKFRGTETVKVDGKGRMSIPARLRRVFDAGVVDGGLRFPQPGWDEAVMEDKFRWATGFVLPQERIDALAKLLWGFETVQSVRDLVAGTPTWSPRLRQPGRRALPSSPSSSATAASRR